MMKAAYKIVANDKNITAAIQERFSSLEIIDEAGMQSDSLRLALADSPSIPLPDVGTEFQIWLGYEGALQYHGLYIYAGHRFSFPLPVMTLKASGAPYSESRSYNDLQTKRTRSWTPRSIGDLVTEIAKGHGLDPAVSADLLSLGLPHIDQIDESDIHLLTRVAKTHDAVAKANAGKLLFVSRGQGKSVSGKQMARVELTPADISTLDVDTVERQNYSSVIATWRDKAAARDIEEMAGSGDPVYRIRFSFPDKQTAFKAAQGKLQAFQRGKGTVSITMAERAGIAAESRIVLRGFRSGIDGEWSVTRTVRTLNARGLRMTIDAESI